MRICKTCKNDKELDQFYKHSSGYRHECKKCLKHRSLIWAKENKENRNAIVKKHRANSEVWKIYRREWDKQSGAVAKRRASIDDRTPPWLDDKHYAQIRSMYLVRARLSACLCIVHHVDHIVPLRGKKVSGLHVPWNLQVVPERINLKKGNRLLP